MTAGKYIPEEVKENGSFQWIGSGYRNGYIDLKGSYYWKPPIAFPGIGKIKLAVRAGVRPWTGSSFREASEEESSTRMVYLTENGSVYHNHADCSYLDLTILLEKKSRIAALRNKSGGRYYPCEKCGRKKGGDTVWITQYGTRYHTDSGCSGLQRKVRMVPEEEAAGKCLCSRCAKKSA